MADENYAIRVSFDGIDKAIAEFNRLQKAVGSLAVDSGAIAKIEAARLASESKIAAAKIASTSKANTAEIAAISKLESTEIAARTKIESIRIASAAKVATAISKLESNEITSAAKLESAKLASSTKVTTAEISAISRLESAQLSSNTKISTAEIAAISKLESAQLASNAKVESARIKAATQLQIFNQKQLDAQLKAQQALANQQASQAAKQQTQAANNAKALIAQLERQKAASAIRATDGSDKEAARIAQETLRFKQQIAAIDAKLIDPVDIANAKALAAEINKLNLDKIKKGFDDATPVTFNQFIGATTEKARDLAEQLQQTSFVLERIGTSFNQVSQAASQAFIGFDTARTKVATLSSESDAFAATAVKLSGDLNNQVTSTEILTAQYEILSSGFTSAADASEIARVSVLGAKAGFTDTATVADATTSVLNAYGLSASEAANVVDQLAVVQDKGKTTIGQYAGQLGKVAPIAASAGVSLEELNAAVASVTINGVKTETAVSGVRQAIVNLIRPTQGAQKELEKIGLTNVAATLKTEGFAAVLTKLRDAGVDSSSELSKIFTDIDGLTAVVPLLNDGLKVFNTNLAAVGDAGGKAQKGFDVVATSAQGRLDEAVNKINESLVKIGAGVATTFAPLLSAIGNAVSVFNSLPAPVQGAVGVIATLAGGVFTLGAALTAIGAAAPAFVGGLSLFTGAAGAGAIATGALSTASGLATATIGLLTTQVTAASVAKGSAAIAAGVYQASLTGLSVSALAAKNAVIGLTASAAALAIPLGLAAAAGGVLFAQLRANEIEQSNDALKATAVGVDAIGNNAISAAQRTQALSDKLKQTTESGKTLSKQQIEDAQNLQKANAERLKALQDEANKVRSAKVVDETKGTRDAQLKDIEISAKALTRENTILAEQIKLNQQVKSSVNAVTQAERDRAKVLKENRNQDAERQISRQAQDKKLATDRANAKAIEAIERENAIKKGNLDRQQALETEALKERQTLALQNKQRAFDDAQNAKKLANEELFENRKAAFEDRQRQLQQAFEDKQSKLKEQRAEKLRKDDEAFAQQRAQRDQQNEAALSGAKSAISNEGRIGTATDEERDKIAQQIAEENRIRTQAASSATGGAQTQEQLIAQAKQLAQVSAIATQEEQAKVLLALDEIEKANKAKQAELDKAEEDKRAAARQASDKAFEAQLNTEKLAFDAQQKTAALTFEQTVLKPEKLKTEAELNAAKLAFERGELAALKKAQAAEERALQLQQTNEDAALQEANAAKLDALKLEQKQKEIALDRAFEDAKIERERTFKEQQRALDKASAIEIQQILGKSAKQIIDAIAVAKGSSSLGGAVGISKIPAFSQGVTNFRGGLALVGEQGAELVSLPRGSNVLPAPQTRSLINNNSGGNKNFTFNISNAGDPMAAAYQVQRELVRADALSNGI